MSTAKFSKFDKLVRFGTLSGNGGGGGPLPDVTADSATVKADADNVTADGKQT